MAASTTCFSPIRKVPADDEEMLNTCLSVEVATFLTEFILYKKHDAIILCGLPETAHKGDNFFSGRQFKRRF
jgi:hypothetical protein